MKNLLFVYAETKTQVRCALPHSCSRCLCFRYIDYTIPLISKSEIFFCGCSIRLMSNLVGRPRRQVFSRRSSKPVPIAQMVERPLREREVVGSNPGRAIPKALKMVPVATLLGAQHYKASTGPPLTHSITTNTTNIAQNLTKNKN